MGFDAAFARSSRPLHPTKTDMRAGLDLSALCQMATFALQQIFLFDHLVGAGEERRWHSNAKRLGGFHINDQLETSRLLDRQIGGPGAFEDFVDVHSSL